MSQDVSNNDDDDHDDGEGCHDGDDDDVYVDVDVYVDSYADAEHRRPSCWFNCLQSLQRSD